MGHSRPLRLPLSHRQSERRQPRLDHRSVCPRVRHRETVGIHARLSTVFLECARSRAGSTPPLADLVLYEVNIAELGGDLDRTRDLMAYLSDLGVNGDRGDAAVECRRLGRLGLSADRLFRRGRTLRQIAPTSSRWSISPISMAIAVIVDVVYGHTGVDFPYYDAYTRLQVSRQPVHGTVRKGLLQQLRQEHRLQSPVHARVFLHRQPSLARGLSHRRIPLRLRAELLGRSSGRGLRKPGVRNLPARKKQDRAKPAFLESLRCRRRRAASR